MFLDLLQTPGLGRSADALLPAHPPVPSRRDGVDSEYGRLESVLLADPRHLDLVPCNSVSNETISKGLRSSRTRAARQHGRLVAALEEEGIEVRLVPAEAELPDLAFARDTSLMSPWGLIGLRPGAAHRMGEVDSVMRAARACGVPVLGRIGRGRIEGGDVAMIRPGLLAIGISGNRSDDEGAGALAALYRSRGWEVILYPLDPHFLHLDTVFCMIDRNLAVACTEVLEESFLATIGRLGIELLPMAYEEARRLGCNMLSLGGKRVVTSGACPSVEAELALRGYRSITLDLSEFTMCGGGVHCLTMPLRRARG